MKGGKTNFSQRVNVAAQLGQNLFNLFPTQDCVEEWGEWWLLRGHDGCDGCFRYCRTHWVEWRGKW